MSQLTDNLNYINTIKGEIKSAIESKGVSMSGVSFPDYPAAIGSISTAFVTETLNVLTNGTYTPGQGVDGFSQVVVDVPQSVTGFTYKDIAEITLFSESIIIDSTISFVGYAAFATAKGNGQYIYTSTRTYILDNCSFIGDHGFANNRLSYISIPNCNYIYGGGFLACSNLLSIDLPRCTYLDQSAFAQCTNLSYVNLPVCSSIYSYAFRYCDSLTTIILGSTSVCSLARNGLSNVPTTVSIFVPSSLVSDYQAATYWSSFSSRFFPISE